MDSQEDLIGRLQSVRHFQKMGLGDLHTIVASGQVHHFPAGVTLFSEGDPCAGMFVLLHGRVHLCKIGPQGQTTIMAVIQPVIMFNEVAVLDGGPNPTSAVAIEKCTVWRVEHDAFHKLVRRYPHLGLSLLSVLATRSRQMIAHYEDLSFRSVVARTAKLILDLSSHGRQTIQRRDCSIEEMASRIASVPEAISRSLNALKSAGAIRVSRTEIAVLSLDTLTDLAQIRSQFAQDEFPRQP
ncbi:MAG: Crp/Fnr family transcriptional regulator [Anaerolineales bacterium]|nr:Crp/Fnr family transcriptional regulator [Anaerolineales bacterium]